MERNAIEMDVILISDSESSHSTEVIPINKPLIPVRKEIANNVFPISANDDILTLSSNGTERCPVTWSSPTKKLYKEKLLNNVNSLFTPSPRSKVSHWLTQTENAIKESYNDKQLIDDNLDDNVTVDDRVPPPIEDSLPQLSSNRCSTMIRQDYNKSSVPGTCAAVNNQRGEVKTSTNSVVCLEEDSGDSHTTSNMEQKDVDIEVIPSTPPLSTKKLVEDMLNSCDSSEINKIGSSVNSMERRKAKSLIDIPLSPETQKKRELCEYLKLMNMNPTDGRSMSMRQNRRSSRVKHLALMSEKKEIERKLNTDMQDDRKKRTKSCDGDSKYSSENSRGSKMSSKRSLTTPVSLSSTLAFAQDVANENIHENGVKPKLEKRCGSKTPSKPFEVVTPEKLKIPAKFLQVHEVSTTSIPKIQSSIRNIIKVKKASEILCKDTLKRRSESSVNIKRKERLSINSSKSDVITKKSFTELCMNVKNLKPLRNLRHSMSGALPEKSKSKSILNFSFSDSVMNIPNTVCDFDESAELFINEKIKSSTKKPKKVAESFVNEKIKSSMKKPKQVAELFVNEKIKSNMKKPKVATVNNRIIRNIKRSRSTEGKENSANGPKRKMRKLSGTLKKVLKSTTNNMKSKKTKLKQRPKVVDTKLNVKVKKTLEKNKMYGAPKQINKLRSKGRLKQIEIKKVLLKEQKKKSPIKKKIKVKMFTFIQKKDFTSTELIQHAQENKVEVSANNSATNDKSPKSIDSAKKPRAPSKAKQHLPEPEVWKNFTLEHRKAFMESIKFVKNDEDIDKLSVTKQATPEKREEKATDVKVEEKDKKYNMIRLCETRTPEAATEVMDKVSEECEDIIKKRALTPAYSSNSSFKQKEELSSEDLEVDRLMRNKLVKDQATQKDSASPHTGVNEDKTDPSRSSCTNPSPNSSSLQTVQSNPEPTASTSKQNDVLDIPVVSEIEINESQSTRSTSACSYKYSEQDSYEDEQESHQGPVIPEVINITQIEPATCNYVQLHSGESETKSLHYCLTQPKRKHTDRSSENSPAIRQNWDEASDSEKLPKNERKVSVKSHTIFLLNTNGAVINAYFVDYHLVIVQELMINFWSQTPLGNILGAQNMWISKGSTRRMVLDNGCVNKESTETIISNNNSVAYIELWTKEHKSDKRERPVADVFVAIYMRLSHNGPDKKVLQLENIKGFASDVQYIVLRSSCTIIVSWTVNADTESATILHRYDLSSDFQTVSSITEMQSVSHYVSSLHNIEDCDTLILGCGNAKLTLWNLEDGYIVATIDLMEIHPNPRTVWAKCDRGFLFTLHESEDNILQLLAINSFDSTWKKLQTYKSGMKQETFLGVCMEHGVLIAFYESGFSSWIAGTGELLEEEACEDGVFLPYGKHIVVVINNQVHVRHALEYLITSAE